jgi:hypothetical protein
LAKTDKVPQGATQDVRCGTSPYIGSNVTSLVAHKLVNEAASKYNSAACEAFAQQLPNVTLQ